MSSVRYYHKYRYKLLKYIYLWLLHPSYVITELYAVHDAVNPHVIGLNFLRFFELSIIGEIKFTYVAVICV